MEHRSHSSLKRERLQKKAQWPNDILVKIILPTLAVI